MEDDLLKYAIERGMIDLSQIQQQMDMEKRKEILKKHPYRIWQGRQGRWYTYLPSFRGRVQKTRQTRKALEDMIVEYYREQYGSPTLREVFEEWNERKADLNKISLATKMKNEQCFNKFFKDIEEKRIGSVKPAKIVDFMESQISKHNLTAKEFSNLKTLVRGFMKRAKRLEYINYNIETVFLDLDVSDREFRKTIKEDYQEVYNEEETNLMCEYLIKNLDTMNMAILLLFISGMRIGEIVALRKENIVEDMVKVRATETSYRTEKGKYDHIVKDFPKTAAGVRDVVIPKEFNWLLDKIKEDHPDNEWAFSKDGKRLRETQIKDRLYRNCDKLGIYRKSPHKIRKTYVTILLDNNVDSRMVMEQVGHSSIIISERYYHRNRKDTDQKQKVLENISDFSKIADFK